MNCCLLFHNWPYNSTSLFFDVNEKILLFVMDYLTGKY